MKLRLLLAVLFIFFATNVHAKEVEVELPLTREFPAVLTPAPAQTGGSGHSTTLTWVASMSAAGCTSPCTFGYNVFRGTAAGGESTTPLNSTPLTVLTYTDPITLTSSSQTFFYIVEAVEISSGITVESGPSNEISVTFPGIPAAPPSLVGTPK